MGILDFYIWVGTGFGDHTQQGEDYGVHDVCKWGLLLTAWSPMLLCSGDIETNLGPNVSMETFAQNETDLHQTLREMFTNQQQHL